MAPCNCQMTKQTQEQKAAFILSPLNSKTDNKEKGFQCRNLGCKQEILKEKGGLMLHRIANIFKTKVQNIVYSRSGLRLIYLGGPAQTSAAA